MQVEILRLDHNGRGIGKIDGKTVFVPNALPGEIVTLKNIVRILPNSIRKLIYKKVLRK